ncbi:uncharacterized protein [Euwallacea similis]|uniref:uncharacterized protein n=1 Tax=Euwallacea similis TaxID=1736056 RepID=UPI00344E2E2B
MKLEFHFIIPVNDMTSSKPANKNDFSSVDFSKFKCTICDKYLSVPPIYLCVDSDRSDMNICGRCKVPENSNVIQNFGFESLAKYLEFPCSFYPNCRKKLRFGEAEQHELLCERREFECPVCHKKQDLARIGQHFQIKHKNLIFFDKNLVIQEKELCTHRSSALFLVMDSKDKFLVSTSVNRIPLSINTILSIKVAPVHDITGPLAFDVVFSNDNNTITFKNRHIKRCPQKANDWINYIFNLSAIKKIFSPDESELNMELLIHTQKKTILNNKFEEISAILEKLVEELECPICTSVMKSNIAVCNRGHSICKKCKNVVNVCPLCCGQFVTQRNFALEEISKKIESFLV